MLIEGIREPEPVAPHISTILPATETLTCCPLCSGVSFSRRYEPDLCRCRTCGIHFRNPRPDQNVILRCYDEGITFSQWQHELDIRSHLWRKRCALISRFRKHGTLLDIGTGDGYFLNFAKVQFNVEATEISASGVTYARARGHRVHQGTIFDEYFDGKKFDVVTMWHVLEHVPLPGKVLEKIKIMLNPGGILVVAVPNESWPLTLASLNPRRTHPFGPLERDREIHLTHFTPGSLLWAMSRKFDFNVIRFDVDDVHVYARRRKLARYYVNRLLCRLSNRHWDTAMVVICTQPNRNADPKRI